MVEQHHHLKYNYQVCVRQLYIRLLKTLNYQCFHVLYLMLDFMKSDEAKGY